MVNRRGFLTKFLKGAAAAAVIAPTLLLKPRPEPKFEPNVLHDYKPAPPEDLFNHITNIDPVDTPIIDDLIDLGKVEVTALPAEDAIVNINPIDAPFINGVPGKAAHEWLTDELVPSARKEITQIFPMAEAQRADLADWIDQPSFSRPAIEAACGQNPSFWPEGSRERITALGAEALKRSAAEPVWPATENIECGSSLALSSSS